MEVLSSSVQCRNAYWHYLMKRLTALVIVEFDELAYVFASCTLKSYRLKGSVLCLIPNTGDTISSRPQLAPIAIIKYANCSESAKCNNLTGPT